MARMRPPVVPEQPPPVLDVGQVQALLAACEGKSFADRRDAALVALLLDTGVRLAEITDVELADVDMRRQALTWCWARVAAPAPVRLRRLHRPGGGPLPADPGPALAEPTSMPCGSASAVAP